MFSLYHVNHIDKQSTSESAFLPVCKWSTWDYPKQLNIRWTVTGHYQSEVTVFYFSSLEGRFSDTQDMPEDLLFFQFLPWLWNSRGWLETIPYLLIHNMHFFQKISTKNWGSHVKLGNVSSGRSGGGPVVQLSPCYSILPSFLSCLGTRGSNYFGAELPGLPSWAGWVATSTCWVIWGNTWLEKRD